MRPVVDPRRMSEDVRLKNLSPAHPFKGELLLLKKTLLDLADRCRAVASESCSYNLLKVPNYGGNQPRR
jgi:hypothetical protein